MLFEEYIEKHDLNYTRYDEDKKTVKRTLDINKDVAEATNEIIAVFNNEFNFVKLNSSILINIAFKCFLKQLGYLKEEEILFYLKDKTLEVKLDISEELAERFDIIEISDDIKNI